MAGDRRPLVMHVVNRFDVGGLENGVVNLINRMAADRFRHMVVALTEVTDFRRRLQRDDVACLALNKAPGHGFKLYPAMRRVLAEHRPAVLHTRNLGPLEMQPLAAAMRVPVRLHGEHGRELDDLDGSNRKYQWIRRLHAPFVHGYVALSRDLQRYLVDRVGIRPVRITQIYNGVDTGRFGPRAAGQGRMPADWPFDPADTFCVGTVGRMQGVKHQTLLAQAFVRALALAPELRPRLRLVMVGDGPLRAAARQVLEAAGVADLSWLPGERGDVADVMRGLDCFVLPSLAEGISNTILEAMATGLAVVATDVGGNPELVADGRTGDIVPSDDAEAMAQALVRLAREPVLAAERGAAALAEVRRRFSLDAMVDAYARLYDDRLRAVGLERRND